MNKKLCSLFFSICFFSIQAMEENNPGQTIEEEIITFTDLQDIINRELARTFAFLNRDNNNPNNDNE